MSCWPNVSDSIGIASGIRIASATSPATMGCLPISCAHFAHRPFFASSAVGGWWIRSELMCGPKIDKNAGKSVSAAATATTTAMAAISPIVVTKGMPATASETSAIVTVPPAKKTAPPEVATDREIDSRISNPPCKPRM